MKPPFEIQTDAYTPLICDSLEELTSTLDNLQLAYLSKSPTSIGIGEAGKPFGESDIIAVGIGLDPTYITIMIKPCDGEYYLSAGDSRAAGTIMLGGFCEPAYFDRSSFVSWSLVLRAVREFVEFSRRTTMIRWHDWSGDEASQEQK